MKNLLIITLFFLSFIVNLFGNEQIEIKKGEPVTINGEFSSGEWSDASLLKLPVLPSNDTIYIFYKHDGNNLLFAFCKNLKKVILKFVFLKYYSILISQKQQVGMKKTIGSMFLQQIATLKEFGMIIQTAYLFSRIG